MSKPHAPVRAEDLPYRPCVGIMVLNRDGLVWAGKRIPIGNSEYDGSPQLWQMPQGGIDEGEDPLKAAYRELYEETGMKTVTLLAEAKDWINYDLPPQLIGIGLKGKYRGQTQRWFAFQMCIRDRAEIEPVSRICSRSSILPRPSRSCPEKWMRRIGFIDGCGASVMASGMLDLLFYTRPSRACTWDADDLSDMKNHAHPRPKQQRCEIML